MNTPNHSGKNTDQDGFIALTSAIIVSAVLLIVTVTLSYSGFLARFNILSSEYKERSAALAEACVDLAILKLADDSGYPGNETISVGSDSCLIRPMQVSGSEKIIETQAIFQEAYTNLRVFVDGTTLEITDWEELANF